MTDSDDKPSWRTNMSDEEVEEILRRLIEHKGGQLIRPPKDDEDVILLVREPQSKPEK